jgi:hypothetical protein
MNYLYIKTIFVPHKGARNSCEDQALNVVRVHNGCFHNHTKHTNIHCGKLMEMREVYTGLPTTRL